MDNQQATPTSQWTDLLSAQQTITDILPSVTDPIADALELTPVPVKQVSIDPSTITDDFEFARGNMIAAIEKGQEALNDMLQVAGMSQQARSYEVVATLLKTVADANKDLLELSKKKKELLKDDESKGPSTVNNNMFVGNAADLLKMIKNTQNGI
jgi:hypothetical protein